MPIIRTNSFNIETWNKWSHQFHSWCVYSN